ncbi:MAG: isoleucine--tRNA ligase, partial [Rhodospirillaceae bacterium]|nr:isoleucine--tRNA ligase [Rhodospirillaceae bacterium]
MSVPTPDGAAPADAVDYKATVFLPRTAFPMRAGLPKLEPELLKRWKAERLYARLREQSAGREKFILHDGPPYANGNIHIGTGMNKILKDIVTRSQQMLGKDSNYVPGWDCHGLPIEWKIEEGYRSEGRDKDAVPILELRQECRSFAEHWVRVQSDEFQRLGVLGDWDRPYLTMTHAAEAQIVREIHKFLMNGGLYKGLMPVLWSVVEKTALAEAEVEYADHVSTTIWVRFPVIRSERASLTDAPAGIVIWTTTPWTIPGNRAVAYGADIDYGLYEVATVDEGSPARVGDRLVVATALAGDVAKRAKIADWRLVDSFPGAALAGTVCHHPLHGVGAPENYAFEVPALAGEFVTTEQGTGVVHIAPGHGAEDFELGSRHGLPLPETVAQDGRFTAQVPLFEGRATYTSDGKRGDASDAVTAALAQAGALLAEGRLTHSYPHSWRSKAPLIFRATPQWFISMEATGLRRTALKALEQTRFCPPAGYNRLSAMIEARPDWCISRQRAWGVPIAIFVERKTGQPLKDQAVLTRIGDIFQQEGSDAWFARDPQDFLGPDYAAADYDQVFDIVDVWFESGATHSYVLEVRDDLMWPASLYLEGSDQHRGWFHSSLLESCGTRGRAPFDAVLTHGFVLDEDGRKMSKSLGNTVMPQEVADANGADILRLWVAGSDYSQDVRIGPEILKFHIDAYRRLRNTMRYLLGALAGFTPDERVAHGEMPELERYILHRVAELDSEVRRQVDAFDFLQLMKDLHNFCAVDLSAFYFDIRKDALYCDRPDALQRRAARTVMDILFDSLTAWLAPVLCFTAEEAWLCRNGDASGSVHERVFPTIPGEWTDPDL